MEETTPPGFNYVRFARRTLKERWWIIVAVFLGLMLPIGALVYSTTPRLYEASATLFFEGPKSENPLLRGIVSVDETVLNLAILRSRSLAQAVVDVLPRESKEELLKRTWWDNHMERAYNAARRALGRDVVVNSPQDEAVIRLQESRMNFTIMKDGTVLVEATAFKPRVAAELANTYVDVLLARTGSQARDQARVVREMLENLLVQTKANVNESEDTLRKFRRGGGDTGAAVSEQSRVEVAKLAELENAIAEVQVAKEIANSRLAFLRGESQKAGKVPPSPRAPVAGDALQGLRDRLNELEAKLAALNEKYTDKHPLVIGAKADVDEAQGRLRLALKGQQEPRPGGAAVMGPTERAALSKQMADLEVELATHHAKEESLRQRIDRARRALSFTSGREQEYTQHVRSVETQRNLFGLYTERLNQARMSEQSQIRSIRVIDLASTPTAPTASPVRKGLILVALVSLGLGVGMAVALEYAYEVIETEDDVVRVTGLPILGSVPTVDSPQNITKPMNFRETTSSRSLALEATRAVATTLELCDVHDKLRVFMVASASAGEGKTTMLVNLGEALAEMDRRVMLIDADLRRPALHRTLQLSNEVGLSDVLGPSRMDLTDVARRLDDWLTVIPAGGPPTNPGALLASKQLKTLLTAAREQADLVLFDSAPVMAVSDDLLLASLVDGVILVVRSGVTQRRSLTRATARLAKVNAPIVGVVVNGLSSREARRHYAAYTAYVSTPETQAKRRRRLWPFRPNQDDLVNKRKEL